MRSAPSFWTVVRYLFLILLAVFAVLPILWTVSLAFKPAADIFAWPPKILFEPTLANFSSLLFEKNALKPLFNSLLVASITTLTCTALAIPFAYRFALVQNKFNTELGIFLLSLRMFPPVVILIPYFLLFRSLGLIDSVLGLVIVNIVANIGLAIWLVSNFFQDIPIEIREAATLEGANDIQILSRIYVPLALPGVLTAMTFVFLYTWNEFIFALTLTRVEAYTFPVLLASFITGRGVLWGEAGAASLLAALPLVLLVVLIQRHFVRGLTMGAIK